MYFNQFYNKNKYHNQKITENGETFDSKKEYLRYKELQLLQRAGEISGLERQKRFMIIPKQVDEKGKLLERESNYIADFVYKDKNGKMVVEDTKGIKTKEYILKRKLMLLKHNIKITEI